MFKRVIEDFACEYCGAEVEGDGYTNHCPRCLWSLHLDNEPGDRANNCNGLMEPVSYLYSSSGSSIMHKCVKCGTIKKNKAADNDNWDAIQAIH
ncbi:MAG: RNHCP domain-containing protein [Patescibacteria group bacterium]